MKPEPTSIRPSRQWLPRGLLLLGLWLLALPAAGCSLLEDEFSFLDRAAPASAKAPDSPFSAETLRP
ncbi:MAG: hypothetical protein IT456_19280 [Planctomycetes bacterium]|nr:hypothetical protein [Planctomycetota bacterium]